MESVPAAVWRAATMPSFADDPLFNPSTAILLPEEEPYRIRLLGARSQEEFDWRLDNVVWPRVEADRRMMNAWGGHGALALFSAAALSPEALVPFVGGATRMARFGRNAAVAAGVETLGETAFMAAGDNRAQPVVSIGIVSALSGTIGALAGPIGRQAVERAERELADIAAIQRQRAIMEQNRANAVVGEGWLDESFEAARSPRAGVSPFPEQAEVRQVELSPDDVFDQRLQQELAKGTPERLARQRAGGAKGAATRRQRPKARYSLGGGEVEVRPSWYTPAFERDFVRLSADPNARWFSDRLDAAIDAAEAGLRPETRRVLRRMDPTGGRTKESLLSRDQMGRLLELLPPRTLEMLEGMRVGRGSIEGLGQFFSDGRIVVRDGVEDGGLTLVHEIGHALMRQHLRSGDDALGRMVVQAFDEAGGFDALVRQRGLDTTLRYQADATIEAGGDGMRAYATLAEEWFVEEWAQVLKAVDRMKVEEAVQPMTWGRRFRQLVQRLVMAVRYVFGAEADDALQKVFDAFGTGTAQQQAFRSFTEMPAPAGARWDAPGSAVSRMAWGDEPAVPPRRISEQLDDMAALQMEDALGVEKVADLAIYSGEFHRTKQALAKLATFNGVDQSSREWRRFLAWVRKNGIGRLSRIRVELSAPGHRLMQQDLSMHAKRVGLRLTGQMGLLTRGNIRDGRAATKSVMAAREKWRGQAYGALLEHRSAWHAYRGVDPEKGGARWNDLKMTVHDNWVGPPSGVMSKEEFDAAVYRAVTTGRRTGNPHVDRSARAISNFFETMAKAGENKLWSTKQLEGVRNAGGDFWSYVPRVFRYDVLGANGDEFIDVLVQKAGYTPADARAIYKGIMDHSIASPYMRSDATSDVIDKAHDAIGQADAIYKRALDLPTDVLLREDIANSFVETGVDNLLMHYSRTVGTDLELFEAFGSVNMREQIAAIEKELATSETKLVARLEAEGKSAKTIQREVTKHRERAKWVVYDVRGVRDALRGTYGLPAQPWRWDARLARIVKQWSIMQNLGGATLASFGDLARPIMVEGMTRWMKYGLMPYVRNPALQKMASSELRKLGVACEVFSGMHGLRAADAADFFGHRTGFERTMSRATQQFFFLNLLNDFTTFSKEISGLIVMNRIRETGEMLLDGKTLTKSDQAALLRSGINLDDAKAIAEKFRAHGGAYDEAGEIWLPGWDDWGDERLKGVFQNAVFEDVERTISTPGVGDRPLWASTVLGSVILQFKGFSYGAHSRILLAGLQDPNSQRVATGVVAMTAASILGDVARQHATGSYRERTAAEWVARGVERSGVLGIASDYTYSMSNIIWNSAALMDDDARTGSAKALVGVAGPTARNAANLVQIAHHVATQPDDMSWSTAHAMRQMLIYQNLLWFDRLFDAGERDLFYRNQGANVAAAY